jgi:hypothetical protein
MLETYVSRYLKYLLKSSPCSLITVFLYHKTMSIRSFYFLHNWTCFALFSLVLLLNKFLLMSFPNTGPPSSVFFFPEGGVGLVPKRGCLLMLAYYAFPTWNEFGERWWNDILTAENRRTRRKTYSSVTLSTTNPTWIDPGVNPGLHGEGPVTNDLSHGTAHLLSLVVPLLGGVCLQFMCMSNFLHPYLASARLSEIPSSHSGKYEGDSLLGYSAM